ncbi:hypothetical protein Lsai_2518 [Legionella sainthelensi]|uniref:DUF1837 domain-containing protein n=1 Tax=Legionella sainthelensi TaxID=28087 RepID=A0A0W0YEB8_9GAMM|nr:hypothetical protein [Legionella sainthelensi]KTD54926.1 hypothetical protein Lsai_2518 [Legionella sainthelensi]VEH37332.1 Uncharacterised protein [Legionella sainthelensi]
MSVIFASLVYENQTQQVILQGYNLLDNPSFNLFMNNDVASRLNDESESNEFKSLLRGLPLTGFGNKHLEDILSASIQEERDWAIAEALAETWLTHTHQVIWPWNMERDKRNARASLPGADLVGFIQSGSDTLLALGEVKLSGEKKYPPSVMSSMHQQIDNLLKNPESVAQLLKWLFSRCKANEFEPLYKASLAYYFNSGKSAITLFGVLVRETEANELDLQSHGEKLSKILSSPSLCNLIALYFPGKISEFHTRLKRSENES